MDAPTLIAVAELLRETVKGLPHDRRLDGLERLGAEKVLTRLARDLEISAPHFEKRKRPQP